MFERPSRVPGAIVWTSRATGEEYRVLPDGCMDIIWATDGSLVVAGPDTTASSRAVRPDRHGGIGFAPGFRPETGVPAQVRPAGRRAAVIPSHAPTALRHSSATPLNRPVLRAMAFDVDAVDDIDAVAGTRRRRCGRSGARRSQRAAPAAIASAFGYGAKTLTRICG
jgi:hypothetical protein